MLKSPVSELEPDIENETLLYDSDNELLIDCTDGSLTTIVSVTLPDKMYVVVLDPVHVLVTVVNE